MTGVFPDHRLSPSGPLLSGQGGPIIQIGFDQCIFTDLLKATWEIQDSLVDPTDLQDVLANAILPRDTSLQNGGPPPPITDVPLSNRMGVTLQNVRKDSLIAVWYSFGFVSAVNILMTTAVGAEDGDGNRAAVGFATQLMVEAAVGGSAISTGSILALGPNPVGAQSDITVFPVAFDNDLDISVVPGTNQVAIMAAEIAQS